MRYTFGRLARSRFGPLVLGAIVGACGSDVPFEPLPDPATSPVRPADPVPVAPVTPDIAAGIYTAMADGSNPVRVTLGSYPVWSPDGRRFAFSLAGQVVVSNIDGTDARVLAAGDRPSWSPDGSRIAFANVDGIAVMNADGSNPRTLVPHKFRDDTYRPWDMGVSKPAWSPDGTVIAFEHLGDADMVPAQVFLVNPDGSNVRDPRTAPERTAFAESDPSWTPDGRLLFWSWFYGVATVDRDGGVPNALYYDFPRIAYGSRPFMAPSGGQILFNKRGPGPCSVWIMTEPRVAREFIHNGCNASWSPDGSRLVFTVGLDWS